MKPGYESNYLRAVDPERPRGVWLRHTAHRSGHGAHGSVWITAWDAGEGPPEARKESRPSPAGGTPPFGPDRVAGEIEGAVYDLTWTSAEPALRHLPREWMYRAPLPRTKLESPAPGARFSGRVTVGSRTLELDGWEGMVGHNWGVEHAERWIWLHGTAFEDVPGVWADIALGRVKVAGRTTPWIANGAVSLGGERIRVGGLTTRARVREDPLRLDFESGPLKGTAHSPREQAVVWRYADPDGSEHHVANCSIAALDLVLARDGAPPLRLHCEHGGAYELGMRETTHGLPVLPFADP